MKQIERPALHLMSGCGVERWFDKNLKGKYVVDPSEMVEVHSEKGADGEWYLPERCVGTHRAYLIGVEPIKKETAEDVLRDIMLGDPLVIHMHSTLWKRAKAILERGEDD